MGKKEIGIRLEGRRSEARDAPFVPAWRGSPSILSALTPRVACIEPRRRRSFASHQTCASPDIRAARTAERGRRGENNNAERELYRREARGLAVRQDDTHETF